jgi:UPF0755 protein
LNKEFVQKYKKFIVPSAITIGVTLLFFALVSGYYLVFLNTPKAKKATEITFVVTKGDGVRKISGDLQKQGIISQDVTFMVYLKLSGLASSIQAGDYRLSGAMTPLTVADILTKGKVASKRITIPEGWTVDQIGTYLEDQGIVTKADFVTATKKNYNYAFLTDKPAGASLEGYLFPDTYQISATANADEIVKIMLENFDRKLTPDLRAAIAGSDRNIFQTVTLASIVEREVSKPEDRKVVAGVFINRLNDDMLLESCATIQYILKSNDKRFSYAQTQVASLYNTYIHKGLPVGPIGDPGIDSIEAVLYPQNTDYYYFFSADGVTYYSKTLTEHEAKVAQYLK